MGLWPTQGDEKRLGPATTLLGTVALSFVIPSEAEGSAVSLHHPPMPQFPGALLSRPFRNTTESRKSDKLDYESHWFGYLVSINLTPEQQSIIQKAIQSGLVRSVDAFIHSAIAALSRPEGEFDKQKARVAGERIRDHN